MITPKELSDAFSRNAQIIKMQTAGLSHAQSLIQLPFRSNCLNWVVGHVVANRTLVLKMLGAPLQPEQLERLVPYQRESAPLTGDSAAVLPLEELITLLEQTQEYLSESLAAITPAVLESQDAFYGRRPMSVARWLFFFYFHDSYHTGQTEILRQASGVDDKII